MFKILLQIRKEGQGTVTYHFENGAKQVASINPIIFKDERSGKDKSLESVAEIFKSTAHDIGAKSFVL